MKRPKEVKLSNGTIVRVEPVPPLAYITVVAEMPELRMPKPPEEIIKGKTGSSRVLARPGTPEYAMWEAEVDKIRRMEDRVRQDALFALSIVAWKLPGQKQFTDVVPDDWEIPQHLVRAGLEPHKNPDGRRWDFICYGLLNNSADIQAVDRAIGGMTSLTEAEVEAASAQFPSDEERGTDS